METPSPLNSIQESARLRWSEPVPGTFKIAGILHMETADTLRQVLCEILERVAPTSQELSEIGPTRLDLSEVETCGTAGLQLLISAQKTAESRRIPFEFVSLSPAVENAFTRFGIETHQ